MSKITLILRIELHFKLVVCVCTYEFSKINHWPDNILS